MEADLSPFEDLLINPSVTAKAVDDRHRRWAIMFIVCALGLAILASATEMVIAQHAIGGVMQHVFTGLVHSSVRSSR